MPFGAAQPYITAFNQELSAAAPYLALGAFVLALVACTLVLLARRRLKRLALGKNGSIEESMAVLLRESKEMKEFRTELEYYLKHAEARLRTSVRGVGVVRFNPFTGGQGGNQSFSAAFLDEEGSGVVLSTLYARDRVGVYGKPLEKGVSHFELSVEEEEAVAKAQASIAKTEKPKKK